MITTIKMIFVSLNSVRDLKEFLSHGSRYFCLTYEYFYKLLFNFEIA